MKSLLSHSILVKGLSDGLIQGDDYPITFLIESFIILSSDSPLLNNYALQKGQYYYTFQNFKLAELTCN